MVALASTTGVGLAPQLADSQHSILRGSPYRCNKVACKIQLSYRQCWVANVLRYDDVTVAPSALSEHSVITSTGNHSYMRIVVWQPSSRSRGYFPRSLVQDLEAKDNYIRSSWSVRVQNFTHVSARRDRDLT